MWVENPFLMDWWLSPNMGIWYINVYHPISDCSWLHIAYFHLCQTIIPYILVRKQ
jgi:hypothetical protein